MMSFLNNGLKGQQATSPGHCPGCKCGGYIRPERAKAAHTRPEVFNDFIADRVMATQLDLLRLMREDDDTVNDTVKVDVSALSKTEQTVYAAISSFPDYSYEKLAAYCHLSRPTIARTIKVLQSRDYIRRMGSDKTGYWEITKKIMI